MPWHCQICEREIKTVTIPRTAHGTGHGSLPRIAHHGFKRPGQGWQTASCFGAKYEPYETNSDAIPIVIDHISKYREGQVAALATLMTDPPPGLPYTEGREWSKREVSARRPAGFTAATAKHTSYYSPRDGVPYGNLFLTRKWEHEQQIEAAAQDIRRLQKRLYDWRPS